MGISRTDCFRVRCGQLRLRKNNCQQEQEHVRTSYGSSPTVSLPALFLLKALILCRPYRAHPELQPPRWRIEIIHTAICSRETRHFLCFQVTQESGSCPNANMMSHLADLATSERWYISFRTESYRQYSIKPSSRSEYPACEYFDQGTGSLDCSVFSKFG